MILFSRKLETVYVMYEKVISSCVCVPVPLILAYRRPVQVSLDILLFCQLHK